jgi:hypothetical protein
LRQSPISYLLDPHGQYAAHFTDAWDEMAVTAYLRTLVTRFSPDPSPS